MYQHPVLTTVCHHFPFLFCLCLADTTFPRRVRYHGKRSDTSQEPTTDLSLGLESRHFGGSDNELGQAQVPANKGRAPNQFLILLFNLLLADLHQSGSFLINAVWVNRDSLQVGTPICFLQGWLVSNGDVAGGLFLSAIAIHTYLTVVWNYKPAQWAVQTGAVAIWVFTYFISALGIAITRNGRDGGGFYVRAGAWCWINVHYENLRLLTHYLFIFISLAVVSVLYTLIFLSLRRRQKDELNQLPRLTTPPSKVKPGLELRRQNAGNSHSLSNQSTAAKGHHPAFLIYPVIYVVCTAPLALGRIATMAGAKVPIGYFCAAGALITSNGLLDVLLWGLTRRVLLFGSEVDAEEVGLETFEFMRTPPGRQFGNMVWVQGATNGIDDEKNGAKDGWGWWGWARRRATGRGALGKRSSGQRLGHKRTGSRSISQESLRGHERAEIHGIQMDVVTTVVVEDKNHVEHSLREYSTSLNS
ncbi:hypothetical protein DL546_009716 [Coniochaeta pulveracea]|uniref:G-protein coupled receptors family 1 profile domain-containing protein n=1 Tax=Coniochaeta pulveracea TaxID=177199 RepID=A0A420YMB0_9PEZI|nr:hypothetical protein DL546_009716 [Coniochaeta pulveracea]